ncbi:hypothetical protein GE09DRAFT_384025 [Coniochaeta sp. 2T2.1]|nr:hypothetical protein GE09DRAFT_384025 [Coniochaeta sp. 2T2.1]
MDNIITLEEHFISDAYLATNPPYAGQLLDKLRDVGSMRLEHMNAGNVSEQVISHVPADMNPECCRAANDELAAAITKHKRLAGLAALPMSDPEAASSELRRCMQVHRFVGAMIDNHSAGMYYDGQAYNAFWSTAQELDAPIYLHPTWPTETIKSALYTGNFPPSAATGLGASAFGWHSDVALHVLRLFASGLFDRFPRLKLIIGHMGEMLPFMLERIAQQSARWAHRERGFKQVWDANVWITTAGVWSVDPMACILRNTKIERILYSVDYPFESNEAGLEFLENLRESGLVDEDGMGKIVSGNAIALLGLEGRRS